MDELLTPVSVKLRTQTDGEPLLWEAQPATEHRGRQHLSNASSIYDVLTVLRNQPSFDELVAALTCLTSHTFWLQAQTPQSASIVLALVTDIVPNYWALLREDFDDQVQTAEAPLELLLACLRNNTGLHAIITHISALLKESHQSSRGVKRPDLTLHLEIFLDFLDLLLAGNASIGKLWNSSVAQLPDASMRKTETSSLAALLANGRILSTAAEASSLTAKQSCWIADGVKYCQWIGYNLSTWAKADVADDEIAFCYQVFSRCLSLGYPVALIRMMIDELLLSRDGMCAQFNKLCFHQPLVAKRVLSTLLEYLAYRLCNNVNGAESHTTVAAVAGLIDAVVGDDNARKSHLVNWCTAPSGAGVGDGVAIRRAVVAVLAQDQELLFAVLEESMAQFGDQFNIKHSPILQQEVLAQILLLSAGYVARLTPLKMAKLMKSSVYLNAISNRIAATQAKSRHLGMTVGEALTALVDNGAKKLDFHMQETETDGAQWLKNFVKVTDTVGPFDSIQCAENLPSSTPPPPVRTASKPQTKPQPKSQPKSRAKPKSTPMASVPKAIIEELDSSDDDDGLVPLPKGSDPEDSDDDAMLVRRDKPKAPVYIRDLIAYLRDTENYDKQKLALKTAPTLIRRKANFGSEVSAHADELAGLLVGLQDKFELDNFVEMRQHGMIALVVAQPKIMAPWFSRSFFEGDFSLAQRTTVLVALGLSARELAGHERSEHQAAAFFPSKRLPENMEKVYLDSAPKQLEASTQPMPSRLKALPPTALENITRSLTASFLGPMAAEAADANSGPDMLKLQSFKERHAARRGTKPRVRAIANTTAGLLAMSFFVPLTAHLQIALRSSQHAVFNPGLLSLYLQTLAIVVDAAGPSTLALPQLTSELWDLLLQIRSQTQGDIVATRGWLFAMTVLIDVNENNTRRLCEEHGREVMDTREWVSGVFERTRGDDGGEENEVKMLAAGVLVKLGEAVERHQALFMGDLIGFH